MINLFKKIKTLFSIKNDEKILVLCCPRCKLRFSEWFEWNGKMYCYPCYGFGKPYKVNGHSHNLSAKLITEDDGIWLTRG